MKKIHGQTGSDGDRGNSPVASARRCRRARRVHALLVRPRLSKLLVIGQGTGGCEGIAVDKHGSIFVSNSTRL
jgi:hypothetical protein